VKGQHVALPVCGSPPYPFGQYGLPKPSWGLGTIRKAGHALAQIRALPDVHAAIGVTASSLERDARGPRRKDKPKELILTMGIDGDPTTIANALVVQQGRWFRRNDDHYPVSIDLLEMLAELRPGMNVRIRFDAGFTLQESS
jgi:hypothetical protein